MSDDQTGASGDPDTPAPANDGRRKSDRRQAQQPFEGPDRRKEDRRAGTDRRATQRDETDSDSD